MFCPLGHGAHKEDSPFLSSSDSASKRNDYYDKNLALFEVCLFAVHFVHCFTVNLKYNFVSIHSSILYSCTGIKLSEIAITNNSMSWNVSFFRKSWTSGQRSLLSLADWSVTQTLLRVSKSTRRQRMQMRLQENSLK